MHEGENDAGVPPGDQDQLGSESRRLFTKVGAAKKAAPVRPAKKAVPVKRGPVTKRASAKKLAAPSQKGSVPRKAGGPIIVAPRTSQGAIPKYPRHAVEAALRIPKVILDQGGNSPASLKEIATWLGYGAISGALKTELASSKKYGFVSGDYAATRVEDRARRILSPQGPTDRVNALREAVLAAPDISEVYNNYRGESIPDAQFFRNTLVDRFNIPAEKVPEFIEIFNSDMESADLVDASGERPRLIDIGRDEAHRPAIAAPIVRHAGPGVSAVAGATCFVMQPFGGHLGTYYESIFKPAIEQAGLIPVRADDDLFATGKIMDQVWRGIRAATVLVAELTSKNPNVFYELGLAHALEKPVVLVSSNTDDVPFDLRHIRVILYDRDDPFWGQKLIDKVADNVRQALDSPEEAIFRAGA